MWSGQRNLKSIMCSRSHTFISVPEHSTTFSETLPSCATRFLCFGLGLCPQDLCRLPFVALAFFLRYSLHIKAFFLGALTPAAVSVSSSLMLLHASFISPFIACISFSSRLADFCVFIVFKKLYFLRGLQHLWHVRDGGSLLSFCQTNKHTNSQTYLFLRYTHIDNRLCSGIWKKYLGQMVGCCLYSFSLFALVLMWGEGGFAVLDFD